MLIPAYNEEKNIQECIRRLPLSGRDYEVLVVDDGSTDATAAVVQRLQQQDNRIRFIRFAHNQGKAHAVEEGIRQATKSAIVILDADMAVAPEDIVLFIEALEQNLGQFANGTRLVYDMEKRAMSELRRIGNFIFALCVSVILRSRLTDTLCGTKAFFRKDFTGIRFAGEQWGDFVLLANAGAKRLKIAEIPVRYFARQVGKSKMHAVRDGFKFLCYIVRMAAKK